MIACESFFKFALPEGSRHHEDVNPNSETGVDFEIAGDPVVWTEVKNWESPTIPERYREAKREEFLREIANDRFWEGIVGKFEGTHDCLAERGERPPSPVLLLLLECHPYSRGQAAPDTSILERKVARSAKVSDGSPAVLPFVRLSAFVANAQTAPCALRGEPPVCLERAVHCSYERRLHLAR